MLAGLISILAGLLKLGRVAQFFSESVMVGFITGLALVIIVKQVPKMLGIEGGSGNFWERLYEIIIHLPETHLPTLITGVLCLILLIALEHYFHKIPAALVALVFGIAISVVFGLEARGVEIVGEIPAGLAPPQWPAVGLETWLLLLPGALGLALVNFAEAIGPARSFASTHKYKIDAKSGTDWAGRGQLRRGVIPGLPHWLEPVQIRGQRPGWGEQPDVGHHCRRRHRPGGAVFHAVVLRVTRSGAGGNRHRGRIRHGQGLPS